MKILYCIAGLYNSAGMERVITNKANYFAKHGNDVYIVTAEQQGRECYYKLADNIKLYDLGINYSNDITFLGKLLNIIPKRLKHIIKLRKLLFKIKADIVISTFGNEFFFLHMIKDGSKKVAEVHFCKNYRLKKERRGLWRIVDLIKTKSEERLVKKYDAFVTLTNEDLNNWGDITTIHAIPNSVSVFPRETSNLLSKNLLVVGRLNHQKGLDRLLEIWKDVSPNYPEWKLNIYGSGELYKQLSEQIRLYNLQEHTFIHNPTSNISEAYLHSSCYLMTSRYEGLPMVLLEAMSYGLPVISFACPCGPKDLILDGNNGYLVQDGDINTFREKIIDIIENEKKRVEMGINARSSIMRYREETIMQEWNHLFKSLL